MAFKKNDGNIKCTITEFIAPLKESDSHDWVTGVARVIWNDNPAKIDIRKMNMSTGKMGSGISLGDDEVNRLTNALLEQGYGDIEYIEKAYKVRLARITLDPNKKPAHININLEEDE